MLKNRLQMNITCSYCPASETCIASRFSAQEKEKFNSLITKMHILETGEHLYYQNDSIKYLFIVYSGSIKEYSLNEEGDEKVKDFYFTGDVVAIENLSSQKTLYSLVALQKSQICILPHEVLYSFLAQTPTTHQPFIYFISNKLQQNNYIPFTTNAKKRVAAFLIYHFYKLPKSKKIHSLFLPMPYRDIASFLGLAYETISRILHLFQEKGLITLLNKKIHITNITGLKLMVDWSAEILTEQQEKF